MSVQTLNVSVRLEGKTIAKETADMVDLGNIVARMSLEAEAFDEIVIVWSDADDVD